MTEHSCMRLALVGLNLNTIHKLSSKEKEYPQSWDSKPGLLGGKQECYLCATQPPKGCWRTCQVGTNKKNPDDRIRYLARGLLESTLKLSKREKITLCIFPKQSNFWVTLSLHSNSADPCSSCKDVRTFFLNCAQYRWMKMTQFFWQDQAS